MCDDNMDKKCQLIKIIKIQLVHPTNAVHLTCEYIICMYYVGMYCGMCFMIWLS